MWDKLFELLPSMFLIVFSMMLMLKATGIKYSLRKTILIVIPFLIVLIFANLFIFSSLGIYSYDNWSILTVFLPELIMALILGKRKGLSCIAASTSSYVTYYIIVLLRNVLNIYFESRVLEYVMYFVLSPLMYLYLDKFYNGLHDRMDQLIPKFSSILAIYSIFIYAEFYLYRFLIYESNVDTLRLEIFGVATISVYIISILLFDLILQNYHAAFEKAKDKEKLELQMKQIINQFQIRVEKDKQMKIIRHDTRHVLTIVSTLLKEGKKKKAIEFIDEQINIIDSTKVATYCKDALINAIIYYYKELCDKNNINLKIRIKNIDKQLKISTSEVAIVLANCLENAFKAVNKLKENREIDFKFINNDGVLLMQISNNYEGTIKLDRKNRPITGSSNHGIGTKSIQEFVSKYNLMLDYEITDTRFSISIIF
jgi:hypothetical protein